jgi:putative endonuclease
MHLHPSSSVKRRAAEHLGRHAEDQVALTLEAKGFILLARRLRTGAGELDLVAANATHLVFVEVKARNSLVEAAYSISPRAQGRLLEAASVALATHPEWERPNMRFDVALVCPGGIETLEDAIRYN